MTRSASSQMLDILVENEIQPYYAIEMLFDGSGATGSGDGAVRLWTGFGDKTIDGNVYTGSGNLLNIDGIDEVADLSAKGVTVTLSGISSAIVSAALQEPYQGRIARIYFGVNKYVVNVDEGANANYAANSVTPDLVLDFISEYYSSNEVQLAETLSTYAFELFSGLMDVMSINQSGDTATIQLTIESKLITLQKPNIRRYTSENHKLRHSTDTFFDFVSSLQDKEIAWGRTID